MRVGMGVQAHADPPAPQAFCLGLATDCVGEGVEGMVAGVRPRQVHKIHDNRRCMSSLCTLPPWHTHHTCTSYIGCTSVAHRVVVECMMEGMQHRAGVCILCVCGPVCVWGGGGGGGGCCVLGETGARKHTAKCRCALCGSICTNKFAHKSPGSSA